MRGWKCANPGPLQVNPVPREQFLFSPRAFRFIINTQTDPPVKHTQIDLEDLEDNISFPRYGRAKRDAPIYPTVSVDVTREDEDDDLLEGMDQMED